MGIYGLLKGFRRKKAHIGETISRGAIRTGAHVRGVFSGARGVRGVRRDVKSFAAREIIDSAELERQIRIIHRTSRQLAQFTEERLTRLFKKISTDPETFNHLLEQRIDAFTKDMEAFVEAYHGFLLNINDMLQAEMNEHVFENQTLLQILNAYKKQAKERGIVVPEALLAQVEKELGVLLRSELKEVKSDIKDDHRTRASLFSPGASRAVHKIKKIASKYGREELEDVRENLRAIQDQLAHGVQPDFLLRFLAHIRSLQHVENYFKQIHRDVQLIIHSVEREAQDAYAAMARFLSVFKNTEAVRNSDLFRLLAELQKGHEQLHTILRSDVVNVKGLNKQIVALRNNLPKAFNALRTAADQVRQGIAQDPRKYLHSLSQ